ncbi:hypothetical protein BJY01DRAFT_264094 [Aspergillus pseudoustus]|uniref:Zn(2)-C6 fungal-type domain-containing protein n=1 Tax=Aspergillus pseudoustus TaxID=1810923 RepID=A0ABR4JW90_9EURO
MVNHGVSRGCETCRARRKKCDEARPTCTRCAKAGRVCLGYRSYVDLQFRHYKGPTTYPSPSASPSGVTDNAVAIFLEEYSVSPTDPCISRGFLSGLPALLADAEPSSDLVCATEIVAWTSLANQTSNDDLKVKARQQYISVLHSFQGWLFSCQVHAPTAEALAIAILLGLYEIISGSDETGQQQQHHLPHVRGVCALLLTENSPFDLRSSTRLFQVANPLLTKDGFQNPEASGVLCAPSSSDAIHSLDAILIQCHPLFECAEKQLRDLSTPLDQIYSTLRHAIDVQQAFDHWELNIDASWCPETIGFIGDSDAKASSCPLTVSGPMHSYFDIYVAAVMNTYRKTHLMVLDIVIRLAERRNRDEPIVHWIDVRACRHEASQKIDEIAASVPYHLVKDLDEYMRVAISHEGAPTRGRAVGGLLLLHPLYVLSTCSVVPLATQEYARKCLGWIGQKMGIGQATVMSRGDQRIPFWEMAEGHVLIWAGMLIQSHASPGDT